MGTPLGDEVVPVRAKRSSDRSGAPDTRLRGRRLILARVVWGAAVSLIVVPFLAKLLANYTFLQTIDWMALLVALAVVATVTLNGSAVFGSHSAWGVLGSVLYVLGTGVYVLALSLFPDGRFVPRWMRWLLPCWAVAGMVALFFPDATFGWPVYTLVWRAELVLILIAQFSRYRSDYSPLQRQQTKWILFGGCIVVIIDVGLIVPQDIFPALGQAGSFYQLVTAPQSLLGGLTFIRGN